MLALASPLLRSVLLASLSSLPDGPSADWPQFRGPGGTGIAPDSASLPVEFGPGEGELWKQGVPEGHSSPCLVGDRLFVTAADGHELQTHCLDRDTGVPRWTRSVTVDSLERTHEINGPASSTPASDGHRVYVVFGSFGLLCYDLDGEELWRRPLPVAQNTFGTASSPIVVGERVVFLRDEQEGSFLELIEGATGETVWRRSRSGFASGWSTPMLWNNDGVDELVVYGIWWLTGYSLADGRERWSVPGLADEPCITPVTGDGLIFVTSYNMKTNPEVEGLPTYEGLLAELDVDRDGVLTAEEVKANRSVLSRADADGEGDHPLRIFLRFMDEDRDERITAAEWQKVVDWVDGFKQENALVAVRPGDGGERLAEVVWKERRGVPECPSPLYHDGRVYLLKNGGLLSCLDAATGALHYRERLGAGGPYYASLVVGDGKLYAASARGEVTVVRAGDAFEVLATNDLGERIMATPAVVGGRLYVRTAANLYAFAADPDAFAAPSPDR